MVLEGSFPLHAEFFETHEHEAPEGGWKWIDSYHYTESQIKWFLDLGCTWKKVEAGPGDVILWDSRCIHYGAAAEGDRPRVATCECTDRFGPARSTSLIESTAYLQTSATNPHGTRRRSRLNRGKSASRTGTTPRTTRCCSARLDLESLASSRRTSRRNRATCPYSPTG